VSLGTTDSGLNLDATQQPHGSADKIRREIRSLLEQTIDAAANDPGRLGWIREQVLKYLSTPDHWDSHSQAMEDVLAEEKTKRPKRTA
jgi:hypothetical protein